MSRVALAVAAAATLLAHSTLAQSRHRGVELAPTLGAYAPTMPLPYVFPHCGVTKGSCDIPDPPPWDGKQNNAVALGGRVTSWFSPLAALEGAFWYAPSGVATAHGEIVGASLRGVLNVIPHDRTVSLLLTGGPGVVSRFGDAWADYSGTTAPGAVVGLSLDVNPRHGAHLRAQVEDYMYTLDLASSSPTRYSTGPIWVGYQHDLLLSVSLSPAGWP